jgi:hypothetical protein
MARTRRRTAARRSWKPHSSPSRHRVPPPGKVPLSHTLDAVAFLGRSAACYAALDALFLTDADPPVATATTASSGEVEASLLRHGGGRYGGVGSDHTDREVQTYGVAVAEQMCDKPIASEFWRYEEATPHWDRSIVRSWIDEETLYQEGPLGARMHPDALLELAEPALTDGTVMFCRTSAAIGGIRPAYRFRYQRPRPRTPARRPLRDAAAGARFLTLRCGEA